VDGAFLLSTWLLDIFRKEMIVYGQIFSCKLSVNYTIMHEEE